MRNTEIVSILKAVQETPWAILPSKLEEIRAFLQFRLEGGSLTADDIKAKIVGPQDVPRAQQVGSVAVIPVFGTIGHRMNMLTEFSGGTSTEALKAQIVKAIQDDAVSAIVLDFNSPGGTVGGLPELHSTIMEARAVKPIVGSANAMAASAAYWLLSATKEISVTPSGEVGSIGVFYMHEDLSKAAAEKGVAVTLISAGKYKTEGNAFEPLTEEARASIQSKVDAFYQMFVGDVAAGRGVSISDVKSGYGQGRMLTAAEALKAGMVDRIETLDATISRLSKKGGVARAMKSTAAMGQRLDMGAKFLR